MTILFFFPRLCGGSSVARVCICVCDGVVLCSTVSQGGGEETAQEKKNTLAAGFVNLMFARIFSCSKSRFLKKHQHGKEGRGTRPQLTSIFAVWFLHFKTLRSRTTQWKLNWVPVKKIIKNPNEVYTDKNNGMRLARRHQRAAAHPRRKCVVGGADQLAWS